MFCATGWATGATRGLTFCTGALTTLGATFKGVTAATGGLATGTCQTIGAGLTGT